MMKNSDKKWRGKKMRLLNKGNERTNYTPNIWETDTRSGENTKRNNVTKEVKRDNATQRSWEPQHETTNDQNKY